MSDSEAEQSAPLAASSVSSGDGGSDGAAGEARTPAESVAPPAAASAAVSAADPPLSPLPRVHSDEEVDVGAGGGRSGVFPASSVQDVRAVPGGPPSVTMRTTDGEETDEAEAAEEKDEVGELSPPRRSRRRSFGPLVRGESLSGRGRLSFRMLARILNFRSRVRRMLEKRRKTIRVLASYVAGIVLRRSLTVKRIRLRPTLHPNMGVVLIADVSGFTKLAGYLARERHRVSALDVAPEEWDKTYGIDIDSEKAHKQAAAGRLAAL